MGKYFREIAKAQEFLELKQRAITVMDYVTRFTELKRLVDDYVATNLAKVRRFENGLKLSIRARIVGLRLQKYGFHGWDSPDHRERYRGCSEHLGCEC